jgi:hypothetical protein
MIRAELGKRLGAVMLVCLCLAPVPGDVGSCAQPAVDLAPERFFGAKRSLDCIRCEECAIGSSTCVNACDRALPTQDAFPEGCFPVVHDGEVCLRKLLDAECGDYARYMRDENPVVPTECNFCPREAP